VRAAIDRDLGPAYAWPGNVRELEQCVRRVVLTREYTGDRLARSRAGDDDAKLLQAVGEETAKGLVVRYCRALYAVHGTYEEVARRTGLDRRTVKAYLVR
jgi:transcriptional regulator of acetoin/glycerol metabolism